MYSNSIDDRIAFDFLLDATHETEGQSEKHSKLESYVNEIGKGLAFCDSDLNQECEREIDDEKKEENEVEVEVEKQFPYEQVNWGFNGAFKFPEALFKASVFIPLHHIISEYLGDLSNIKWHDKLYCTHNFCRTIQSARSSKDLSMYLRLINPMLVLEDGRVVLIAVYELDKVLPFWWEKPNRPKAVLKHISTCASMPNQKGFGNEIFQIPCDVFVSIKLFRGYIDCSESEEEVLVTTFRKMANPAAYPILILHTTWTAS